MKCVFYISDRTGITTESIGNALLTQFPNIEFKKFFIPFIDSESRADNVLVKIYGKYLQYNDRPIIFTSIMNPDIRNKFQLDYAFHIDFFEAFIPMLESELKQSASKAVGMSHGMTDENKYYKRIDAIDFSLYNDDGATVKNYEQADVILVGVSRVGKTPTCLYLAVNYGIKAANFPFAELDLVNDKLPKFLVPYHHKLFGLTIEVDRLHHIRTNRLPNSKYADINTCKIEIKAAEHIMTINNIPFVNVSKKSIEEISVAIMQQIKLK
ncbi:MAG: kinase/pyrophosphorylase [Burkholderiales bacterium]|nr:kinase/pyrophosphorylase [Burkholderiales bacterium]